MYFAETQEFRFFTNLSFYDTIYVPNWQPLPQGGMTMKHLLYKQLHTLLVILMILSPFGSSGSSVTAAERKIPAFILLTKYSKTLNIGDEFYVGAITSNGKKPVWRSSNSRVASVNTYGLVTARKNGQAKITAKISGAEASCRITVNKTSVYLNTSSVSLEHGETLLLKARTSNGSPVQYKSKKTSIVSVTEDGKLCGEKPGNTYVTVSADGTKATCRVRVKKPVITLNHKALTLTAGSSARLHAKTSSGLAPEWKSSRSAVADVDDNGCIYAGKPGTARICAKLDGVKKYCSVKVTK